MNYQLSQTPKSERKMGILAAGRWIVPFLKGESPNLIIASIATILAAGSALSAPLIISHVIDSFITVKDMHGVWVWSGILVLVYVVGLVASYIQTIRMGGVGRRVLFNLRNAVFTKLQDLPVAFFNQNKAGDLISRINNDTDQLNQFFSQALMQFMRNFFLIAGAAIFLLVLNIRLGAAALIPAVIIFIVTRFLTGWVKRKNLASLQSVGRMSAEIQENINNFKVVVAFNRLDYFRQKFGLVNQSNFRAGVGAGLANNVLTPIYAFAADIGMIIVLAYGIYLIGAGHMTIGLLIGFLLYVNNFYNPLQQLASVWASLQQALAGMDRISEVIVLNSDMPTLPASASVSELASDSNQKKTSAPAPLLEFQHVSFGYPGGRTVLHDINLQLEKGKTYALVGPTGGGKTTTASLMARLYDPTEGIISLDGRDIRSYDAAERTDKIGFILQEPFLFSGTIKDNLVYGNDKYKDYSAEQLRDVLEKAHLSNLLARFEQGLDTPVTTVGDSISLGQKQLIAFIRALLHSPELLILDEATANIDTVTEQLLEDILNKLPKETTKVIIAHRLNTIRDADVICFVNGGEITMAGSMEHAVEMLLHNKRES